MIPPAEIIQFLKTRNDFVIATHVNPDGDGLGSAVTLSMALRQLGKTTHLLCKDPVPKQCLYLPGQGEFLSFDTLPDGPDQTLVLVDCNDISRIHQDKTVQSGLKYSASAVIDHHETEKIFGDVRWIEPQSPATGLMMRHLVEALGVEMTEPMAANLYAAIAVDTGNFRHENTNSEVLRVASELVDRGANPTVAYRELFESWSDGRFCLFLRVINTVDIRDNIAFVTVTQEMFRDTGTGADDTENFVDFPRIMKKIDASVLLREVREGVFKVSLRSKGEVNVAKVAAALGGGGHRNAAGCNIEGDPEAAKTRILELLRPQLITP
ncbi:MAG: bifunctional oligoribonuclease/PAP phosphatase NrnA [Nitrospirales bacterium]|nr:bifunctional oligoribonuclease/PAP phosphatase NrnA [Nitrospirales bacterium]